MSDTLRLRPSPLSSTPMTTSTSETPPVANNPSTPPSANNPKGSTTTAVSTASSTNTPPTPSTPSKTHPRHHPIHPINTLRANKPLKHRHTTPSSASRTPRSPFGAWTGPPKTPLAPHFSRQTPAQVMALFVLAVLLLGLFILAAVRDIRGGWVPGLGELRSSVLVNGGGGGAGGSGGSAARQLHQQQQYGQGQAQSYAASGAIAGGYGYASVVPVFPLTRLAVTDDPAFQDTGERGHEAWLRMLPRGDGLVRVDEPRKHGLPRSERLRDREGGFVGEAEVFEVAVVRELECLLVVREVLGRYEETPGGEGTWGLGGEEVGEGERRDARRCLDHLRQAILCHADTTLERTGGHHDVPGQSRKQSPNAIPHVDMDGTVGVMRTCKDWGHIRHWLEENRADRDL